MAATIVVSTGLVAAPWPSSTVDAATITVNSAVDQVIPGRCSLRQAIAAANTDSAQGGCAGGSGADTIRFDPVAMGSDVVTLNSDLPAITSTITLVGDGITVDAQGASVVTVAAGASLQLDRISWFRGGAGSFGNELPAFEVSGALVVGNSTLEASRFAGIRALNTASLVVLVNSTVSGSGGTGLVIAGSGTVVASTVAGNRAGLASAGSVSIAASVIARSDGGNCQAALGGTISADAATLSDDTTCSNATVGDADLRPLADAGGPTPTHVPGPASRALGLVASCDGLGPDQRGIARPATGCDAGAVQALPADWAAGSLVVTTAADDVVADGRCSLREAAIAANATRRRDLPSGVVADCGDPSLTAADVITFDHVAMGTQTIELTAALPPVTEDIVIEGSPLTTLDARGGSRHVNVTSTGSLSLADLVLTGGAATTGGAVLNAGVLTISRSELVENRSTANGGAIANSGSATLVASLLAGNRAGPVPGDGTGNGGAIANQLQGDLTIVDSDVSGNSSSGNGGAIANSGVLVMTRTSVKDNRSGADSTVLGNGGALSNGGSVTVRDSLFEGNRSADVGGAITTSTTGQPVRITGSTFVDNVAPRRGGGAIWAAGSTDLTVVNSTITANDGNGALVTTESASLVVAHATIAFNDAPALRVLAPEATVVNTIVTDSAGGTDCEIDDEVTGAGSGNLAGDTSCDPLGGFVIGDAALQPLAFNGGATPTHLLRPSSAAIGAADQSACAPPPVEGIDQRGVVRPQGSACDIGAVEVGDLVNSAPTATDVDYAVDQDTTLVVAPPGVLTGADDVDGDPLTVVLVDDVSVGTLDIAADGGLTFVPPMGFVGQTTFTFRVSDGLAVSEIATARIEVLRVNVPPVARDDEATTFGRRPVVIDVLDNDEDPDGDGGLLGVVEVGEPSHGVVEVVPGGLRYVADAGFTGTDQFTYRVSDGEDDATATVTVTVLDDPGPPVFGLDLDVVTANDPGLAGAVVTFVPTVTGGIPPVTVTCDPPAGSFFPIGRTTVRCTARDSAPAPATAGDSLAPLLRAVTTAATDGFDGDVAEVELTVTVNDVEAPVIGPLPDVSASSADGQPVSVTFVVPTATDNSGVPPTVECDRPATATYPVGTTLVVCTATDAAGNVASRSFAVVVTATGPTTSPPAGPVPPEPPVTTAAPTTTSVAPPVATTSPSTTLPGTGADLAVSVRAVLTLILLGAAATLLSRQRGRQRDIA